MSCWERDEEDSSGRGLGEGFGLESSGVEAPDNLFGVEGGGKLRLREGEGGRDGDELLGWSRVFGEDNFDFLTAAPSSGSLIKHLFRKILPIAGGFEDRSSSSLFIANFSRRFIRLLEKKRLGGC